jgi:hypothetical protein
MLLRYLYYAALPCLFHEALSSPKHFAAFTVGKAPRDNRPKERRKKKSYLTRKDQRRAIGGSQEKRSGGAGRGMLSSQDPLSLPPHFRSCAVSGPGSGETDLKFEHLIFGLKFPGLYALSISLLSIDLECECWWTTGQPPAQHLEAKYFLFKH